MESWHREGAEGSEEDVKERWPQLRIIATEDAGKDACAPRVEVHLVLIKRCFLMEKLHSVLYRNALLETKYSTSLQWVLLLVWLEKHLNLN